MGSNRLGSLFQTLLFGESHGDAVGAVIDGCPANIPIDLQQIDHELSLRAPGRLPYTSPRYEDDRVEILSGLFEGHTTGAPITLLIRNQNVDSAPYETIKKWLRPGHANYTYLQKYGCFDYRGGGPASARKTAALVAAGSIAKQLLSLMGISVLAYLKEVGGMNLTSASSLTPNLKRLHQTKIKSRFFCLNPQDEPPIDHLLAQHRKNANSVGGIVEGIAAPLPVGLGDPFFDKLEAKLAQGMLALPASKGFEMGDGFAAARMTGLEHNDLFYTDQEGTIQTRSNHAGGTLGGISTGMPLVFRVAFKPTSTFPRPQQTITLQKESGLLCPPARAKHDCCLALRAVPLVEMTMALVLADRLLVGRSARLGHQQSSPDPHSLTSDLH